MSSEKGKKRNPDDRRKKSERKTRGEKPGMSSGKGKKRNPDDRRMKFSEKILTIDKASAILCMKDVSTL